MGVVMSAGCTLLLISSVCPVSLVLLVSFNCSFPFVLAFTSFLAEGSVLMNDVSISILVIPLSKCNISFVEIEQWQVNYECFV